MKHILPLGIRRKIDAKRRSFDSSFRYPTPNKLHLNHRSKSQCNHLFVTQGSYLSICLLVLQNNMFYSKEINLLSWKVNIPGTLSVLKNN